MSCFEVPPSWRTPKLQSFPPGQTVLQQLLTGPVLQSQLSAKLIPVLSVPFLFWEPPICIIRNCYYLRYCSKLQQLQLQCFYWLLTLKLSWFIISYSNQPHCPLKWHLLVNLELVMSTVNSCIAEQAQACMYNCQKVKSLTLLAFSSWQWNRASI